MQLYSEFQSELLSRLQVADNSTLYTTSSVQTLIKDAHMWATALHPWPSLRKAKTTSTDGSYYYDYPANFKTDSIFRVIIDEIEYNRKNFEDFLDFKENNSGRTDKKIFADFGRQIFIFPTPSIGTDNFDVWGEYQVTQLSGASDTTIFTYSDETGNEAIVKKALSVALAKTNKQLATQEETEAKNILDGIYRKILQRQQRDQKLDQPMFNVPDFFPRGGRATDIGKFSI